eukprot:TRINITY_DN2651_c0_g1_i1.p1 TRINITY_DN2651_c0_g1~~TRINITY_DN2651_c0_g1_i1.p1  ORF type:complete len:564 (+),score=67.15 TRINITY_DN2651_c0_g1_i1:76-1692(+)
MDPGVFMSSEAEVVIVGIAVTALTLYLPLVFYKGCYGFEHLKKIAGKFPVKTNVPTTSKVEAGGLRLAEIRFREYARDAANFAGPCFALVLIVLLYTKLADWDFNQNDAGLDLHVGHVPLTITAVACHSIFLIYKTTPSRRMRMAIHILVVSKLLLTLLGYKSSSQVVFDRAYVMIARLVALVFGGVADTCLLNCIYGACAVYRWYVFFKDDPQVVHLYGSDSLQWFAVQEFLFVSILTGIANSLCSRVEGEARATVEAKLSRAFEQAASQLLNVTHSVVVKLNAQLRLIDESIGFAAFLMRGTDMSLAGSKFEDFFFETEDSERFCDQLQTVSDVPQLISVRIRDVYGSPISVDLLVATFKDIDDSIQHLVGIRELELDSMAVAATDAPSVPNASTVPVTSHPRPKRRRPSGRGTPSSTVASVLEDVGPAHSTESSREVPRLMVPNLGETLASMRSKSLAMLFLTWNLPRRTDFCCSFHSWGHEAIDQLHRMRQQECLDMEELFEDAWQCIKCGMLAQDADRAGFGEDGTCYWCAPT